MGQLVNFCAGTNMQILPAKQVDAILVSVPYNASDDNAIRGTKMLLQYAGAKWSQLDSGGYQIAKFEKSGRRISFDPRKPVECSTSGLNLTPQHLIDAASKIQPTIMNALDFPIGRYDHPDEQEMEFMKKLGFNVTWAIETSQLRKEHCPGVKLFIPMQCYDLKQFDFFLSLIHGISYDGFSIPTRNFTVKEIALFLVKFYQLGVRQVHILGSTEFFLIALAAYMARHVFEWVSLDATTWREQAQYSNFLNQHTLSAEHLNNVHIDESIQNDCGCPRCNGKSFTYIANLPQTDRIAFLRQHNFFVIDRDFKDFYQNAGTILELERHLKGRHPKTEKIDELIRTLSLVDALKDANIAILEELLEEP